MYVCAFHQVPSIGIKGLHVERALLIGHQPSLQQSTATVMTFISTQKLAATYSDNRQEEFLGVQLLTTDFMHV